MAVRNKVLGGTSAIVIAVAMVFIAPHEGLSLKSYRDIVGVWTICRGTTSGVTPNMAVNKEECERLYSGDVGKAFEQTYNAVQIPITVNEFVAYTSFTYNLGIGTFKKSTLLKKLNSGDRKGACNEIIRFKYAGYVPGTKIRRDCSNPINLCRGIWKRRLEERELCLKQS